MVFGQEEEGIFSFSQQMVDDTLRYLKVPSLAFWVVLKGWNKNAARLGKGVFSGAFSPFFVPPAYWLAPVVNLCVSDANKNLLVRLCVAAPAPPGASASTVTCGLDANPGSQVRSAWLLPLLLDTLLLDPGHVRAGLADGVKTAIQADAADCLMQIALFEPGRALLKADQT
jgi:hypothetical protein